MILDESIVNKTLLMYGINYSGFDIEQREALLASGKLEKISDVLNYLVNELGISPKSIEKCPSIMYLNTRCIKDNYEFLIVRDYLMIKFLIVYIFLVHLMIS